MAYVRYVDFRCFAAGDALYCPGFSLVWSGGLLPDTSGLTTFFHF